MWRSIMMLFILTACEKTNYPVTDSTYTPDTSYIPSLIQLRANEFDKKQDTYSLSHGFFEVNFQQRTYGISYTKEIFKNAPRNENDKVFLLNLLDSLYQNSKNYVFYGDPSSFRCLNYQFEVWYNDTILHYTY